MKKLAQWLYAKLKMLLPLRVRIWIGSHLFEYIDLIRFYILRDWKKTETPLVTGGYVRFLKYIGIKGITFYKVNPIIKESILMSFKPYIKQVEGQRVSFSDSENGEYLTLISRRWEVPGKNTHKMMDARDFLLTAGYFLSFPLEDMVVSAMEAIVLAYQSIVIVNTNSLSQKLYDYCAENCKENVIKRLQIISGKALKYNGSRACVLKLKEKPDVVITCELPLCRLKFRTPEKKPLFHLPFFYLLCGDATRYFDYQFELDIINNLLPRLIEQGVHVLLFRNPQEEWIDNLPFTHIEQAHIELKKRELNESDYVFFGQNVNIRNVIGGRMVLRDHCLIFDDRDTEDVHWKSGERYTVGNTGREQRDLYLFGPCLTWGALCSDDTTIGSNLRRLMGEDGSYAIHNCGCTWEWMPWMMRNKEFHKDDIVIIFTFNSLLYQKSGWFVEDISPAYRALGSKAEIIRNCWDQAFHINYRVNESIAKMVYRKIGKMID